MKTQKTIYMLLVIIMVMTMAVSCNNTPDSGVQDTQDQPVTAPGESAEGTSEPKQQENLTVETDGEKFLYYDVDGGVALGSYQGDAEEIIIPESHNGKAVVEIAERACVQKKIVKVTIPDSVKIIRKEAFSSCDNLTTVIMGNGVEEIEEFAFTMNPELIEVQLSNSLRTIGEHIFNYTAKLETIEIPASLTEIGENGFNLSGLKEITIPKTVKTMKSAAFMDCHNLTTVIIEDGVEIIEGGAFFQCDALKEIYIPASVKEIGDGVLSKTNAVIITPAGSYAETYAKENGITYRNQ